MTDVPLKHVCENYLKSRIIFENVYIFAAVSTIWSNNLYLRFPYHDTCHGNIFQAT